MLQLAVQYVVTIPVMYAHSTYQGMTWFNYIGIALWAIGFYFESVGDYQLKQFKKNPANKGKLMDTGLWGITRHPNYFGDAAMWFGIFFIAISDLSSLWIVVGPGFMAFFLRFVSGVRMLEKKYEGREDFEAYKLRTNAFIPWFKRKSKA
jgi:steroid 5-alpha reductase family enzyme